MTNTNTIKTNSIVKSSFNSEKVRAVLLDTVSKLEETTSERVFVSLLSEVDKYGFIKGKTTDIRNEIAKACEIIARNRFSEKAESLPVFVLKQNYFVIEFQNTDKLVSINGLYASFTKEEKQLKQKTEKTQEQKIIDYLKKSKLSKAELLEIVNSL